MRGQRVGDLRRADAEGVGAQRAMGGGVGIGAGDDQARQGDALFRTHHVQDAVTRIVEENAGELACILLDPKAGIFEMNPGFAEAVWQLARANEILLIADEVVAFRLAMGGWQETVGILPDLTTYGKLVGGGFPVAFFRAGIECVELCVACRWRS